MTTANLDSADLKAVADGGLISEDVMKNIFDISTIKLEFTDLMGAPDSVGNSYAEWTEDSLADSVTDNKVVDGADVTGDDSAVGVRVGNHCQESVKIVQVSTRANDSDTIGFSSALAYQIMQRQKELHRDVESQMCSQVASVADNGDAVAGQSAGFGAWLTTNALRGVLGADGGYGGTTARIVDTPTPGTVRALTETLVRDVSQAIYIEGGDPTIAMMVPALKRGFSEYLYTDAAKIAPLTSEVTQSQEQATAKGAVSVFFSDFSTLTLVANRLQKVVDTDNSNFYVIDPQYVKQGILTGYNVVPLAKTGLSDKRLMSVDYTLKVLNEKAHGVVADINAALPVTADSA